MTDHDNTLPSDSNGSNTPTEPQLGRNEPCPCGSGKKYKRCHGVAAAPKLTQPKFAAGGGAPGGMPAMPPGMENMDPAMMTQAAQMLQRLPKGQLQKLQSIMQRAMAGKDVAREAEEFQKTLPPDFQAMMSGFAAMAGAGGTGGEAPAIDASSMSEEEAREIVAKAAAEGKLSQEKAQELLTSDPSAAGSPEKGGLGKLWKKITR